MGKHQQYRTSACENQNKEVLGQFSARFQTLLIQIFGLPQQVSWVITKPSIMQRNTFCSPIEHSNHVHEATQYWIKPRDYHNWQKHCWKAQKQTDKKVSKAPLEGSVLNTATAEIMKLAKMIVTSAITTNLAKWCLSSFLNGPYSASRQTCSSNEVTTDMISNIHTISGRCEYRTKSLFSYHSQCLWSETCAAET